MLAATLTTRRDCDEQYFPVFRNWSQALFPI